MIFLNFRNHISYLHEKKVFECKTCKKEFPYQITLSKHISERHPEMKIHKCQFCEKRFSSDELMLKHRRKNHKTSMLQYCPKCKKKFKHLIAYESHVKKCNGPKEKIPQVSL